MELVLYVNIASIKNTECTHTWISGCLNFDPVNYCVKAECHS